MPMSDENHKPEENQNTKYFFMYSSDKYSSYEELAGMSLLVHKF